MMQRKQVVLKGFEALPEAIWMQRLDRLSYFSKTFCIRAEQEVETVAGVVLNRVVTFVVYKDTGEVVEIMRGHLDDLEGEFESLKSKWILNYDNL